MNNEEQQIYKILQTLKDPATIRSQAHRLLALAKQDQLDFFAVNPEKMMPTASYIIDVIMQNYPDLNVPYHSRWRHFEAGGIDRVKALQDNLSHISSDEQGKILFELVIISVFLDAGAGSLWRYKDKLTGEEYARSEGLALASLALYQSGVFSNNSETPYRVDADRLIAFEEKDLLDCFQVSATNPLEGVSGRVALLNRLGELLKKNPRYFDKNGRLGDFYAYVISLKTAQTLSAPTIFQAVLNAFNDVWPIRLSFHGISLGDVWTHKALKTNKPGSEYVPFHKLSQWLTYSLIEPLETAGIKVTDLDHLTGLPEYRNGGLLIDTELLRVKNKELLIKPQDPGSEAIVEWRALTVALLDELADLIRKQLHKDVNSLPLAKILQGGTWEAGRRIAKEKRIHGAPPIQIISDGTVF
ncbi:URC4/urg3 family protein [Legionella quateirensis]|uniref:Biotin synthetase like protein n=1 Tax=Legionella quateirensis TaxID=45072 RepID=A0A378KSD9_9GAMM|nr:URC4/urg3 family protein [Legionella quateirensis]KTD42466.1 putative biotin synthetase like protein [Legionella quateirensis]STY17079.1 putative biotin synthetase like protein [Legionella quateirensis]